MGASKANTSDVFLKDFELFENHYTDIIITWTLLEVLYKNPENLKVIHDVDRTTFYHIQRSLIEHIIIQLSRLTDTNFDKNLGLRKIRESVNKELDDQNRKIFSKSKIVKQEIEKICKELDPVLVKLHVHRNKWIAHVDYEHANDPSKTPLPHLSLRDVEVAIKKIKELLQVIRPCFWNTCRDYNYPFASRPERLVTALKGIKKRV